MSEGGMFDRLGPGLKRDVKIEVFKYNCNTFEEAAKIALRIQLQSFMFWTLL